MAANEKARSVAADTGQGGKIEAYHAEILSPKAESVNRTDWLSDFRVRNKQLKGTEIVETVRSLYPGFDKTLLSKCMSPERYGVCLAPDAIQLLKETYEKKE